MSAALRVGKKPKVLKCAVGLRLAANVLAMGSSGFWSGLLSSRTDGLIKTVTVHETESPLLPIGVVVRSTLF